MLEIQGADQKESSQDTTKAAVPCWEKSLRSRWDPTSHGAIQPGTIARTWSFPISINRFYQYAFVIPNKQRSSLSCWSQGLTFTSDQASHSASSVKYKMHKMPLSTGGLSGFKRRSVSLSHFNFPNSRFRDSLFWTDVSCGTFSASFIKLSIIYNATIYVGRTEGM